MNEESPQASNPPPEPQPAVTPSPGQAPLPQMPEPGWMQKNKKTLAQIAIVVIILAGGYIYSRYQNPATEPVEETTLSNALEQKTTEQKGPEIIVTDNAPTAESPAVSVKTENGTITVTAQRGQGYTHLAREALSEYLKTNSSGDLTPEHKIYIEDYLQKHLADRSGVRTGDQVTFSESEINDAISSAQGLTERQLSNLQKYVPLVPSLR